MAERLPHELLFHIICYLPKRPFQIDILQVCNHWHDLQNYELFWSTMLQFLMEEEIHQVESESNMMINHSIFFNFFEIKSQREWYLSRLRYKEKVLIIERIPLKKRRQLKSEIYGDSYRRATQQFIEEKQKRNFMLNILEIIFSPSEHSVPLVQSPNKGIESWQKVIKLLEENQKYKLKSIGKMKFNKFNLAQIFCTFFKLNIKQRDYRIIDLIDILDFLFNKCGISVRYCIGDLFRMKHYSVLDLEELGLFRKFVQEINDKPFGVSKTFLVDLLTQADWRKPGDLEIIIKYAEVIKKRNLERFRKQLVEPYIRILTNYANGYWESFVIFFKVLEIQTFPNYDKYYLITKLFLGDRENIISRLRRVRNELGVGLIDSVPDLIMSQNEQNYALLMFLVEETNHQVNEPIYGHCLLCEMIYNSYLNNISITDDILSMVEKEAIISVETQDKRYSTEEILEYFYDEEEFYLSILEILIDICGVRFKKLDHFMKRVAMHCTSSNGFSPNGLISVIEFARNYLSIESVATRTFQSQLNYYYDYYVEVSCTTEQAHEFKGYFNNLFGFTIIL